MPAFCFWIEAATRWVLCKLEGGNSSVQVLVLRGSCVARSLSARCAPTRLWQPRGYPTRLLRLRFPSVRCSPLCPLYGTICVRTTAQTLPPWLWHPQLHFECIDLIVKSSIGVALRLLQNSDIVITFVVYCTPFCPPYVRDPLDATARTPARWHLSRWLHVQQSNRTRPEKVLYTYCSVPA